MLTSQQKRIAEATWQHYQEGIAKIVLVIKTWNGHPRPQIVKALLSYHLLDRQTNISRERNTRLLCLDILWARTLHWETFVPFIQLDQSANWKRFHQCRAICEVSRGRCLPLLLPREILRVYEGIGFTSGSNVYRRGNTTYRLQHTIASISTHLHGGLICNYTVSAIITPCRQHENTTQAAMIVQPVF